MRITTRIAAGLFLMAALLIGALTYQTSIADRLQEVNLELSRTNLEAARVSIHVLQGIEGVREFAAKASALRDEEYRLQWTEWESSVEEALARLAGVGLSGEEASIRTRIESGWRAYRGMAPALWLDPTRLPQVDAMLDRVREDVDRLIVANEATVATRARSSAAAGERARLGAWISAAAALLVAGLASLLLFESISGPLRRLTRGTRELAEGRFEHRLAVDGPTDLAGLARDFNHMAQRLDELEELKKDFVSHVSHELKTPLAAVQETVEIMLDELPGPLTKKQRHLLELSRRSSSRLAGMIGNLLETSRLEAGAATYDPARDDMGEIVASVLEELRPVAAERGVSLHFRAPGGMPDLVCDGERMREVVANLVGNALKFSPEGEAVEVTLEELSEPPAGVPARRIEPLEREHAPFLFLSVADQGVGIPDEHKPRIFEKFHQVAGKQRIRGQGVGLGLAISRRIVEAHGGAVWVEDRLGGGSLFRVLLPATPARWRNEPLEEVSVGRVSSGISEAKPQGTPVGAASAPVRVLVMAFLSLWVSGCAIVSGSDPEVAVAGTPTPANAEAPEPEPEPLPSSPRGDLALSEGRQLLDAGQYEAAATVFETVRQTTTDAGERAEALWGIALVHLLPESPLRSDTAALRILGALEQESPDGMLRVQALWAHETLQQIDSLTAQVRDHELTIEQLNQTLEMLRRIDLDRRPAGGARPEAVPDGGR